MKKLIVLYTHVTATSQLLTLVLSCQGCGISQLRTRLEKNTSAWVSSRPVHGFHNQWLSPNYWQSEELKVTPHLSCLRISSSGHDTASSSSTPMMSDIALHALTTVFTPPAWCSTLWVNYGDFGAGNGFGAKQEILAYQVRLLPTGRVEFTHFWDLWMKSWYLPNLL
jgi:hypothetical protein